MDLINKNQYVFVKNKSFSIEDIILHWNDFIETYKQIKEKKERTEDEEDFLKFFSELKKILVK